MKHIAGVLCLLLLLLAACEDFRRDQRDDNLFNPADAFIRFDYNNAVNSIAKDSVLLLRSRLDSVVIPVALSAAPQQNEVTVLLSLQTTQGDIAEGAHFELHTPAGPLPADKRLRIAPGRFVQCLIFKERALPADGPQRLRLELVDVSPDFIHLGFPGSGRGRFFDLIYTQ